MWHYICDKCGSDTSYDTPEARFKAVKEHSCESLLYACPDCYTVRFFPSSIDSTVFKVAAYTCGACDNRSTGDRWIYVRA